MANGTDVKVDPNVKVDQNVKVDHKVEEARIVEASKKIEAAQVEAHKADMAVVEARVRIDESKKTPEEKAHDKAVADADTARAKVSELKKASSPDAPMSVETAKVMAPVPGDMKASSHWAQKFGNDPANPKPGSGINITPESMTVRLSRKSPDHPELIEAMVHPDMVGDYERAGWNRG